MGITLTFDTLQFVQRLKKAGIKETEAEAIAEAVRDVQTNSDVATKRDLAEVTAKLETSDAATQHDLAEVKAKLETSDLATKRDLTELKAELKHDLAGLGAELRAEFKSGLAETKAELIKWGVTIVVAVGVLQTSIITALIMRLIPG
ncbi:MAG: CCDC90 family protein [Candidatus Accumulibacter sp.]|jgi:hypothetical protein|nr:CCDC90 family protein [Accumulibacter sp.]